MTQRRIYQNEYPYHLTFKTLYNRPLFEKTKLAILLLKTILGSCYLKNFTLIVMSTLPDHVHLLVQKQLRRLESLRWDEEGIDRDFRSKMIFPVTYQDMFLPRSSTQRTFSKVRSSRIIQYNISHLAQSIKGTFSRKLNRGRIWQSHFNSRIINSDEQLRNTINYILNNYKKHGLPKKYSKYPYQYINEEKVNDLFN